MSLIIKKKSVDYKALESGTYIARCVIIAGVGTQEEAGYKTSVPRYVDEVFMVFEILGYNRTRRDGTVYTTTVNGKEVPEPQTIRCTYTRSLGTKSKLTRHLTGWLGKDPTNDEAFDLEAECLNKACILNIIQKTSETTGNEYNTIESISPIFKQMGEPEKATIKPVCYDVHSHSDKAFEALPAWLQEIVKKSSEWADTHAAAETINISGGDIDVGGIEF